MGFNWTIVSLSWLIYDANPQSIECHGNCICSPWATGRTCVLNCNDEDSCKDSTLKCRSGDPCEVNCNGDNSCEGNGIIDGSDSTDVTVHCIGHNSCKGNTIINCGTSSCVISCAKSTSCDGTHINAETATGLQCTGACGSIPAPFHIPTSYPTVSPTNIPTFAPTYSPTNGPSFVPTIHPSVNPTNYPSSDPTIVPTEYPTTQPTNNPTRNPIITTFASSIVYSIENNDGNKLRYDHSEMSTESIYRLFLAGTVLITMSSMLCCFGICVYCSAKKTKVSEEIPIAVEPYSLHKTQHENDTMNDDCDAKMDELVHDDVRNTNGDDDNESDSSRSELTSCSLSANIGDTIHKLNERDGTKNIKIMDPQMYTWYGYDAAHGVYIPYTSAAPQLPQLPSSFIQYQNNNTIST